MNVEFIKANIIDVKVDALVLPANAQLKEGKGASEAIFKAAGRKKLETACSKVGSCDVGSAVPTLAFDLDANYIIHAVVSKWIDGKSGEYDLLGSAYLSALKVADVMGCNSIAFPLLAAGNNGYSLDVAYQIAKESIESFDSLNLKKAILVLFAEDAVAYVRKQGLVVAEIPHNLKKEKQKIKHKDKIMRILDNGKDAACLILEEQMEKGIEYLKDKENRDKLIKQGVEIAKIAIKIAKEMRK